MTQPILVAWISSMPIENRTASFINMDHRVVEESNIVYLVFDGHSKRHSSIFQPELNAVQDLLREGWEIAPKDDKSIPAFNIGSNSGQSADKACSTEISFTQ